MSTFPTNVNFLPPTGFVRLKNIVGDRNAIPPIPALVPVSRSEWWKGVKEGRYPAPVKLSPKCTCWRVEDILDLIKRFAKDEAPRVATIHMP